MRAKEELGERKGSRREKKRSKGGSGWPAGGGDATQRLTAQTQSQQVEAGDGTTQSQWGG